MSTTNDEAEEFVKTQKKQIEDEKQTVQSKIEELQSEIAELKTNLYSKFGKAINLENAEQTIND